MAHFYILYSEKLDQFYYGSAVDAHQRLLRHNAGHQKSTRKGIPWKLVYKEYFETRELAYHREFEVKRKKSRKYTEWLIRHNSLTE